MYHISNGITYITDSREFEILLNDNAYLISKRSRNFWFETCSNSIWEKEFNSFEVLMDFYNVDFVKNTFRLEDNEKSKASQIFLFRKNPDMNLFLSHLFSLDESKRENRVLTDVTLGILLGYDILDTIEYIRKMENFDELEKYSYEEEVSDKSLKKFVKYAWISDIQLTKTTILRMQDIEIPLCLFSVPVGKPVLFVKDKKLRELLPFLFHCQSSEDLNVRIISDFCLFRLLGISHEKSLEFALEKVS